MKDLKIVVYLKENKLMLKIEKNKQYEIRLMPNFFEPKEFISEFHYTYKNTEKPTLARVNFCYYLTESGEVDCFVFSETIRKHIERCIYGYYGTIEGYFIEQLWDNQNQQDKPEYYYANDDKSEIVTSDEFERDPERYEQEELKKFTDVFTFDKFILPDVKSKYLLTVNTSEHYGFIHHLHIGLKQTEPLYKEESDKPKIISLYDNIKPLKEIIKNYKKELKNKHGENVLIDDEARKYVYDKFQEGMK